MGAKAESTRVGGDRNLQVQIEALGDWFQNLNLEGVQTAPNHFLGDYPAAKWREISRAIPERLDGLAVLDVGCNAGFHALECKRRGARRVVGVDADARYLAQARLAASVWELDLELHQMSVYALGELGEQFDYVFFLGVLYHLRYPLYALDLAVKLVRQRLVVQTMLRGDDGCTVRPDYAFSDHTPFADPGFPKLSFIEHCYAGDPTNWWIPNRAAMEAMLRSAGLTIVAHPEAETWVCEPAPAALRRGYILDLELDATL